MGTAELQDMPPVAGQAERGLPVRLQTLAQLTQKGSWRLALPHARTETLLIWVTRGQGLALVEGNRRGLGAHNVLWLPAGTQFSLDIGPQTFGQVLSLHRLEAELMPGTAQHLRIRDVILQSELNGYIEMVQREAQAAQVLQTEALTAKFRLIEIWFRRMMVRVGGPDDRVTLALSARPTAAQRLAERFTRRIEQRLTTGWNMADFAEDLGVTPTHLTRVCREVAGITAADLLTARHLHEARRLLSDTDVPAQDIARHLGFGSAAYFSRFIQKHTGRPPSSHRPKR